jgi:dCTP deaminase
MIVNGKHLTAAAPITPMRLSKYTESGVSFGLSEAGYDIRINQTVWLFPFRRFVLASSFEAFNMPQNLVGIVHDKSSWIRRGLMVGNSVIEPNWKGWLTLELVYHGWKPLRIPKGAGIAQVIFHNLSENASYEGKYQNQPNKPVPAIRS